MKDNILTDEEIEDMNTDEKMDNIKKLEDCITIEEIRIPIYFTQDEETKEVFIDEDSIYNELNDKLEEIKEKPENFLEIEE